MTFCRDAEVPQDTQGFLCRQSRLAGIVRFVLFTGGLAIAPVMGWKSRHPWLLWGGSLLAAIMIPILMKDVTLLFRATNWVLRIGPNGVWINLRSYLDKTSDAGSVLHLGLAEIASVGRHTEMYSTPSERSCGPGSYGKVGGFIAWKDEFLEIRLNHEQTDELVAALKNPQPRDDRERKASARAPAQRRSFSVWRVSPSVLRIPWLSGHGSAVTPPITSALSRLEIYVAVAESARRERPNWQKLTADEVHELARELVEVHDATLDATALLVRAGGLTSGEAHELVARMSN